VRTTQELVVGRYHLVLIAGTATYLHARAADALRRDPVQASPQTAYSTRTGASALTELYLRTGQDHDFRTMGGGFLPPIL
jgi:hypothetical protein